MGRDDRYVHADAVRLQAARRSSIAMPADIVQPMTAVARPAARLRLGWFVPAAVVSIVTMPLTAVWFLLLGFVALLVTATFALVQRSEERKAAILRTGGNLALGTLVGPTIFLALAIMR